MLELNRFDFERAGMTRKAGYRFDIEISRGRLTNPIGDLPLASELAAILLEDPLIQPLLAEHNYIISLNTRFQLILKRIPAVD